MGQTLGALALLGRVAVVLALLGLTLWAVRRVDRGRRTTRSGDPVELLGTTRLGKGASLSLVRIGGTAYALGVTEQRITLLTETDLPEPVADTPASDSGFAAALQTQLGLLVGRQGNVSARHHPRAPPAADGPATGTTTQHDVAPVHLRKDAPAAPVLEPACRPVPAASALAALPGRRVG